MDYKPTGQLVILTILIVATSSMLISFFCTTPDIARGAKLLKYLEMDFSASAWMKYGDGFRADYLTVKTIAWFLPSSIVLWIWIFGVTPFAKLMTFGLLIFCLIKPWIDCLALMNYHMDAILIPLYYLITVVLGIITFVFALKIEE